MRILVAVLLAVLSILGASGGASADNQYPNGIEGLKAGTLPPPGYYYRMYNLFYAANELKGTDGRELPVGFDADVYCNAHRFLWVTNTKVLGADLGGDVIVPFMYKHFAIDALDVSESKFGLHDVILEPVALGWHGPRYDAVAAAGVFFPIGDYDADDAASIGGGMWTFMPTLGGTFYFDEEKTWSASLLGRYEIHTDKRDVDLTPGNDLHFEYGAGKTLWQILDLGVSGYANWQTTTDQGSERQSGRTKDRVFAVGPEISVMIPQWMLLVKGSMVWETKAKDRPQGVTSTVTLTKIF